MPMNACILLAEAAPWWVILLFVFSACNLIALPYILNLIIRVARAPKYDLRDTSYHGPGTPADGS